MNEIPYFFMTYLKYQTLSSEENFDIKEFQFTRIVQLGLDLSWTCGLWITAP